MEPTRKFLRNRDLDALGHEWDEYKKAVGKNEMTHGQQGMSMRTRAEKIESLVRHLMELAPPRAEHVSVNPATADINRLLGELREAREAVLPRRRPHAPKDKYLINHESKQHIAFMREFAGQWNGNDAAYIGQHFPHLKHAAEWATSVVALYDRVEKLQETYTLRTVPNPLPPEARKEIYRDLVTAKDEMLANWPKIKIRDERAESYLPKGELDRYNEAILHGIRQIGRLPMAVEPNRAHPVEDLQKAFNELRYEACAAAQRGFLQVSRAYRADRRAMIGRPEFHDARDPIGQDSPMLDRVYHARWALLADAVYETVKSNRKTLEHYSGLIPQTKAEAEAERAHERGVDDKGQGQLF